MLTQVLEAFKTAIDTAEASEAYQKTARKIVGQIDALVASADALPDEFKVSLPTEEEVERLKTLTGQVISPEMQSLKAKVEAALTLGPDAGLVDFDEVLAKELVDRYSKLMTSFGTRRGGGGGGGRQTSGIRTLSHPMRMTVGDSVRTSGNRSGGGDWTWVRWQITDDAKAHDGVSREQLDGIRALVQQVEAGTLDKVDEVVVAGDGTEYHIEYPVA